ncbi:hypothetical protein KEM56_001194, partial [Ascosphaera pollenicola]
MDSPSVADDVSLPDAPTPRPDDELMDKDDYDFEPSRPARLGPTDAEARELLAHGKKSYKRKYAKEKIKYELAMRDCNELFKEEAQIRDLAKRLREQNDQLLEILADLNGTVYIDASQRYNLDLPVNEGPALDDLYSLPEENSRLHADLGSSREVAEEALQKCKDDLRAQKVSPAACREIERDILMGDLYRPKRFYAVLRERMKACIPGYPPHQRAADANDVDLSLGFLSSAQESAYLEPLDQGSCRLLDGPLSDLEREREAALRNPMSVFNWFRRDPTWTVPDLALTAKDGKEREKDSSGKGKDRDIESMSNISDKGNSSHALPPVASRHPAARASKSRASLQAAALAARQAEDTIDDDAEKAAVTAPAPTRGKRKRDDDAGYRPKGGSGARATRKRRDDTSRRTSRRAASAATPSESKSGGGG